MNILFHDYPDILQEFDKFIPNISTTIDHSTDDDDDDDHDDDVIVNDYKKKIIYIDDQSNDKYHANYDAINKRREYEYNLKKENINIKK